LRKILKNDTSLASSSLSFIIDEAVKINYLLENQTKSLKKSGLSVLIIKVGAPVKIRSTSLKPFKN
jgi:hypothetical protein